MDMQKIYNNIKHKKIDLKIRLDYAVQMEKISLKVKESVEVESNIMMLNEYITEEKNNIRQKFKIFKRILDSNDENQTQSRIFIATYLKEFYLKQYIFGTIQSKAILINTIKRINQLSKIHSSSIICSMNEIGIEAYQQSRNVLQLIDMLLKNNEKDWLQTAEQEGYNSIISIVVSQFHKGKEVIIGDSFKMKWLEYFVDILRSMNNIIKIFHPIITKQISQQIGKDIKQLTLQHAILTKEVLTQLFLLMLQINPQASHPDQNNHICIIHYLHARNVVLNENILSKLIELLPNLKQTEHKCQLLPILLKAFQNHYHTYNDKQNIFDQIIILFQVGRSIYSYLQEIITIIIKEPHSKWNFQGNFIRKFFIATIILKNQFSTDIIFQQWPTVIKDIFIQAGNMTVPYANDCALILFKRLFQENQKSYPKWAKFWLQQYKACLLQSTNRGYIRGIIQFINPILLSINSEPYLLKEILTLNQTKIYGSNLIIGIISLLKCFKQLGKIIVDNEKSIFYHCDDKTIIFSKQQIKEMLLSNDSSTALKAFQFISVHLKSSQPLEPLQLELMLQFYRYAMKTSIPQYRKSYLTATKKMFERLRIIYENQLTKDPKELQKNKRYKPKIYFKEFKAFLSELINICYENIFPDVIFQISNPYLQIILLIGTYFNRDKIQVKKGQIFQPSNILQQTSFFQHRNFENLLCCLQSSYQSVRFLTHQIMKLFYDLTDIEQIKKLWSQSLINANKLAIKSYEYACRILAFISQTYPHLLNLSSDYKLTQLRICALFFNIIQERYEIFKLQFATQEDNYYKNLIHGILTVFSYTFDHLAANIRDQPNKYQPYYPQIKHFLALFFQKMNQIILFSVQVCSSNISTVVLDSLPQSQTDKKYKVDCRGHFLQESNKNVGSYFQSTALLTSMQNEEQGIENMLVVSFYLLTRQAGLVFQSIGNLVGTVHSINYIPNQSLVQLVNTYFYALINLKHMGSVDRISGGLGKMAKIIFDNQDKRLNQLPQILLEKLLTNLKEGNFTNILRRSAGVPYAFTCLLKSQALKRKQMIEKTITTLLNLSEQKQNNSVQLRIHSLNILKKLFQDGDLKGDLDPYVSKGFISSIKGFTCEQWGVRNSSLMLFSVLANRTLGIKPTYNLLQFFHKCPDLLQFFTEELKNMKLNTMYPPLYPIVLLLSRLLPFDLKQRNKINNKGQIILKQIRKQKLLQLLPLIEQAGCNNNYMGRVMTAKAILPFMQINNIIPYCLKVLTNSFKIDNNNLLHYNLATVLQLLLSLQQITNEQHYQIKLDTQLCSKMQKCIQELNKLITRKLSQVNVEMIIKIIHHMLRHYRPFFNKSQTYHILIQNLLNTTKGMLIRYFEGKNLIIEMNMGDSMAIKECLNLHIELLAKYPTNISIPHIVQDYSYFLTFLKKKIEQTPNYLSIADTQLIQQYLHHLVIYLKQSPRNQQLQKSILSLITSIQLSTIQSDNILIQILTLRTLFKLTINNKLFQYIEQLQDKTNNHFLKIAIFKYIQSIDLKHQLINNLLYKFSKPQELQQLRQCCVQFIQIYPQITQNHYIVYIRLLQDQEYQIRCQISRIISLKLTFNNLNQEVIKNYFLQRLTIGQFQRLLKDVSDYQVKMRNNNQERIFSYDKPNKYRSDITNIMFCLINNPNLIKNQTQKQALMKMIQRAYVQLGLQWNKQVVCVQKYANDIINRNEYQFETIVRTFLMNKVELSGLMKRIFMSHPLLEKIYKIYGD